MVAQRLMVAREPQTVVVAAGAQAQAEEAQSVQAALAARVLLSFQFQRLTIVVQQLAHQRLQPAVRTQS